jgi:arylsulfatase A-like enzyme
MKENYFLLFLFQLLVAFAQAQRPNIIYIMSDDMGYGDLSCYGQKKFSTPNLDRLASQGMKFTQAYAAGALCTPTRASFFTGRYPQRTPVGLMEPLIPRKRDSVYGLSADYPSIATLMKQAGYETVLIGKWHLGWLAQHSPLKNGFDYFFGIHSGAADYIAHRNDARAYDLYEMDSLVYSTGYLTHLLTQKATAFLQQKHQKPFFFVLTYTAPHWPWQGPDDKSYPDTMNYRSGGSPATYAAMMKALDYGVGAIMKTLDEQGLSKNTIVIFTNDNGGELPYASNGFLSGRKNTLWEGGIRVPAFVRWPGKIKAGVVSSQAVITMDWTATMLAAGNAQPHQNFPLDGSNLLPLLIGKQKETERTFYWRTRNQRSAQDAVREGRWKYLRDEKGEYLFDLLKDEGEQQDVKAMQPQIFQRLKDKWLRWNETMLKPVPL